MLFVNNPSLGHTLKSNRTSKEERELLNQSLDDLVANTPQANVAIVRLRNMMSKVGPELYGVFKEVLTDIISEAAKKAIFGQ